jgi:hypothetical protein
MFCTKKVFEKIKVGGKNLYFLFQQPTEHGMNEKLLQENIFSKEALLIFLLCI